MAAGLKTIISLSFVRFVSPLWGCPPLTLLTPPGPRPRHSPRNPLVRALPPVPAPPGRRYLRYRTFAELDMWTMRQPR